MYEILVRNRFAAAHALKEYDGPCARLHGHTWHVEVAVRGRKLDRRGMLVDFKEIKAGVKKIIEELDHQNLNELEPFKDGGAENPTAENLARYIYLRLGEMVKPELGLQLALVRVWESPDASAAYLGVD